MRCSWRRETATRAATSSSDPAPPGSASMTLVAWTKRAWRDRTVAGRIPEVPFAAAGRVDQSDDLVDRVGAGEAVELELALVLEVHVPGALRQLLDDGRREDLAAPRLVGDPRGEDHVLAVEVRFLADRLAGVQPDAHADRPVGVRAELLVDGAV